MGPSPAAPPLTPWRPSASPHLPPQTLAGSLNSALERFFPASEGVDVIAEPGRFFAEPGMTLFTRVYGKRVRTYNPDADSHYYWISDGAYGSMNCLLYDHAVIATQHFPVTAAAANAKSKARPAKDAGAAAGLASFQKASRAMPGQLRGG